MNNNKFLTDADLHWKRKQKRILTALITLNKAKNRLIVMNPGAHMLEFTDYNSLAKNDTGKDERRFTAFVLITGGYYA